MPRRHTKHRHQHALGSVCQSVLSRHDGDPFLRVAAVCAEPRQAPSPACAEASRDAPYVPTTAPGARLPHAWLTDAGADPSTRLLESVCPCGLTCNTMVEHALLVCLSPLELAAASLKACTSLRMVNVVMLCDMLTCRRRRGVHAGFVGAVLRRRTDAAAHPGRVPPACAAVGGGGRGAARPAAARLPHPAGRCGTSQRTWR